MVLKAFLSESGTIQIISGQTSAEEFKEIKDAIYSLPDGEVPAGICQ